MSSEFKCSTPYPYPPETPDAAPRDAMAVLIANLEYLATNHPTAQLSAGHLHAHLKQGRVDLIPFYPRSKLTPLAPSVTLPPSPSIRSPTPPPSPCASQTPSFAMPARCSAISRPPCWMPIQLDLEDYARPFRTPMPAQPNQWPALAKTPLREPPVKQPPLAPLASPRR